MTYIITARTRESILMASDTRLNYFNDKIMDNEKYQEIICIADCIRKTFFIDKAKIGIQFLGIGYFPDVDSEKYPISHFIKKLEKEKYVKNFKTNAKNIFNFLKNISKEKDTGQYIKGVMSGFVKNNKAYVCIFNTFNNEFSINEFKIGEIVDSEGSDKHISFIETEVVAELIDRISKKALEKYWNIGGPIEILKITNKNGIFIRENKKIFNGTQKELINCFKSNLCKINGEILQNPYLEKYVL